MTDLPMAQQLFLYGVAAAFSIFILAVGGTHIYVNLPSRARAPDQTRR